MQKSSLKATTVPTIPCQHDSCTDSGVHGSVNVRVYVCVSHWFRGVLCRLLREDLLPFEVPVLQVANPEGLLAVVVSKHCLRGREGGEGKICTYAHVDCLFCSRFPVQSTYAHVWEREDIQ